MPHELLFHRAVRTAAHIETLVLVRYGAQCLDIISGYSQDAVRGNFRPTALVDDFTA